MNPKPATGTRTERDPIGEKQVPAGALYNEERGFMGAAELANKAIETGKSVNEVVAEEKTKA